ncbi:MAG: hypothetical protein ACI9F9_002940 [Candidatus Paceibacteria bacterium]|jgi:hypothetical protein
MNSRQTRQRFFKLAFLAVFPLLFACQKDSGQGLVIQNPGADRPFFVDFGSVASGRTVEHTYELKNTDSKPITVQDITPSCSCTQPKISFLDESGNLIRGNRLAEPVITIPPGVTANLSIAIDTNHIARMNADKLAMVVLRCDSENRAFMSFELHIFPTQAYQVSPKVLDLGNIPISTGSRTRADLITGVPLTDFRILGVASQSEGLEVTIDEQVITGETLWRVEAVLSPPLSLGPYSGEVALRTTDASGETEDDPFVIKVLGHVVPDVVMFPPALPLTLFPEQTDLEAKGVLMALAAGHRIKIVDVLVEGKVPANFEIIYEPQAADSVGKSQRWDVALRVPNAKDVASFAGRLQITLEDPGADVVMVQFLYRR